MPTPEPISILQAVADLGDLGIFPVIALSATIGIAAMLYRRFRR